MLTKDTPAKTLERIIRVIPYPDQIHAIEIADDAVRFRWRGQHFRVTTSLGCDTIVGDCECHGDDTSILLAALIRRA